MADEPIDPQHPKFGQLRQFPHLPDGVADQKAFGEKVDVNKILRGPCPHTPWATENVLAEQDLFLISGDVEIGKSYVLLETALALALGRDLFGFFATARAYRVLYLDAEMPRQGVHRRLWRMIRGLGLKTCPHNFDIWRGGKLKLDQPQSPAFKAFKAYVAETRPEWICVDGQRRIMTGEENSSKDINELYDHIRGFRDEFELGFGCISHIRKATGDRGLDNARQRLRGSTDIPANLDAHIAVDAGPKEHQLSVVMDKSRHSNSRKRKPFLIRFDHDNPDDENTPFRLVHMEAPESVLDRIRVLQAVESDADTIAQLVAKTGFTDRACRYWTEKLEKEGLVGVDRSVKEHRYRVLT